MLSYDFSGKEKDWRWSELIEVAEKERLLDTQFLKEVFRLTVVHCNELQSSGELYHSLRRLNGLLKHFRSLLLLSTAPGLKEESLLKEIFPKNYLDKLFLCLRIDSASPKHQLNLLSQLHVLVTKVKRVQFLESNSLDKFILRHCLVILPDLDSLSQDSGCKLVFLMTMIGEYSQVQEKVAGLSRILKTGPRKSVFAVFRESRHMRQDIYESAI